MWSSYTSHSTVYEVVEYHWKVDCEVKDTFYEHQIIHKNNKTKV